MIEYGLSAGQNEVPYVRVIEERKIIHFINQQEVMNFEVNGRLAKIETSRSGLEFSFESGYFVDIPSLINEGVETYTSAYLAINGDHVTSYSHLSSNHIVSSIPKGEFICITYNEQDKEIKIKQIQAYLKELQIKEIKLIVACELYDDFQNPSIEIQILQER